MADETKVTLKVGVIAAAVAALVVFILNVLWAHSGQISTLQANQVINMKNVEKIECAIEKIPAELASINTQLYYLSGSQKIHAKVSKENNTLLKKNGDSK